LHFYSDPIAENTLQQSKPEELQINIPEQVIRNFVTPSRWDQPGVNFINVLVSRFCTKFWRQKIKKLKRNYTPNISAL
jgi:hypothetical protein